MDISPNELDFLRAASDLVLHQTELYPILTRALGTDPYHFWMIERSTSSTSRWRRWIERRRVDRLSDGTTPDGLWRWDFHGLECDLVHTGDGRHVRFDFGPSSRHLAITDWGVMQYVMCVKPPWRTFDRLATFLATRPPPWNHLSGDHAKMCQLADRLHQLGLLVPVAPKLGRLVRRFTRIDATSGRRVVEIPKEFTPPGIMDLAVWNRSTLSSRAERYLEDTSAGRRE